MRLRMTDKRERRMESLVEASDEKTKSKAIDKAIEFYIKMRGNNVAIPTGAFDELMERAEHRGSVTPAEIAEILDTEQLPVEATTTWSVGDD